MERVKGIEPSYAAWEAAVLPLNYARKWLFLNFWLFFGSQFLAHLGGIHKAVNRRRRRLVRFFHNEDDVRF